MRDPNEKVVIGYLRPAMVHGAFMECLLDLLTYDVALHRRVAEGGGRLSYQAGCNLAGPRNEVVKKFLAYGKADWLWFVDSDMTFAPDTLERLLEHADPDRAPVVGGLCFGFDGEGNIVPTLYSLDGDDPATADVTRFDTYPVDAMFQVVATGAACLLVHKSVLERMRDFEHPTRGRRGFNDAYPWFQELEHDGRPVGEDIGFCWRAGMLRIPVFVNTAVKLGHVKDRILNEEAYLLAKGMFADITAALAEREAAAA